MKYFSSVFNESLFVLCLENVNDKKSIKEIEHTVLDLGFTNVQFKIKEETSLFESNTLSTEILNNLRSLDGITFFGHTFGAKREKDGDFPYTQLYETICSLYFSSLNWMYDVNDTMFGPFRILYGANLTESAEIPNKYHWKYLGGFYWINTRKLYDTLNIKNLKLPLPTNRYFSELLWGNLFDIKPIIENTEDFNKTEMCSHCNSYLISADKPEEEMEFYSRLILSPDERKQFKNFKETMIKNI